MAALSGPCLVDADVGATVASERRGFGGRWPVGGLQVQDPAQATVDLVEQVAG